MFGEFGRMISSAINSVTGEASGTRIDTTTTPISIEYPAAQPVRLKIEIGVGKLRIGPGGEHLVEGNATYNIQEWAPQTVVEGGNVTLKHGQFMNVWPGKERFINEWDLALGTAQPFDLTVQKGVADATAIDFGGLPLTGLTFQAGAGETAITFDQPNPQSADRVDFKAGAGKLGVRHLLNANAKVITVEGGAGELRLEFDGEPLQHDLHVTVSMGVGELIVSLKDGIPVQANVNRGLGGVEVLGNFREVGRGYETPDFATATGPKVQLDVKAGVGSIKLRTT